MSNNTASAFPAPLREVEGITEYVLSNGLKVLFFPDPTSENVTVNITYLVGSRHEGRGEAGMAHLLEHMLFKGTPTYPNIKAVLQDRGAFYNATTWFDRTNYFETMAATDDNLAFALKLEADRMINSWIRQADLDAEMTVVRNEFEMGENDPTHVLHDQMLAAAYLWHNYGKTTIGNRSDIERVPVKNLRAFYENYYQPDNAVLIVSGKFDLAKAKEWTSEYFGTLAKPTRLLDTTYTEEPVQEGTRNIKLLRVGDIAQTAVAYHVPAASHPDYAALVVLSEVLSDEPGGILYQSLVQAGMASELFSMVYALKEPGLFMAFAKPTENDKAEALLSNMVQQLEHLSTNELLEERIEKAKTRILKRVKLALKSSKSIALKLSESIAQGDYRLFFYNRDQVKVITSQDVARVATTYLIESNRTTGLFIPITDPKRAVIPQTPDVSEMLKHYVGSEKIHLGEAFEATTQNIEAHVERSTISSHFKTAMLNKSTRGQGVQAKLILRFGNEETLKNNLMALQLIPHLLARGTQTLSFQAVQDKLDALHSALHIQPAQPGVMVVGISSDKEHIAEVIEIATDLIRSPQFSREEFLLLQTRELAELKNARNDPMHCGMRELERLKNPYTNESIHYVSTVDEEIIELESLTFEQTHQLYQSVYGANHIELSMIGDIDPSVTALIEERLGDWISPVPYQRVKIHHIAALDEQHTLLIPDKKMAVVTLGVNFTLRDDDPHYAAMRMANYLFGESMNSRLMIRLREQEGLSYGGGSSLDVSRYDVAGSLTVYAMCATDKADYAMNLMQEEYHRWMTEGVTETELREGKLSFRQQFNNLLANDGFVLQSLSLMIDIDRTFDYYADFLTKIETLQLEDIQKALTICLKDAPVAKIKAGDFSA